MTSKLRRPKKAKARLKKRIAGYEESLKRVKYVNGIHKPGRMK